MEKLSRLQLKNLIASGDNFSDLDLGGLDLISVDFRGSDQGGIRPSGVHASRPRGRNNPAPPIRGSRGACTGRPGSLGFISA